MWPPKLLLSAAIEEPLSVICCPVSEIARVTAMVRYPSCVFERTPSLSQEGKASIGEFPYLVSGLAPFFGFVDRFGCLRAVRLGRGFSCRFSSAAQSKPCKDMRHMMFNGLAADEKSLGDLWVG